jgi:hypothetical protein
MNARTNWLVPVVGLALVAMGVVVRLSLRDIPNFAPVAALGLFAGYLFATLGGTRGKYAPRFVSLLVPLAIMAISDLVIGGYDARIMAVVYASLAFPALVGQWLEPRLEMGRPGATLRSTSALVGASLASSVLFFVTTNFAVWALGSIYESSPAGLSQCFVRALPFFRYTLAGDLFFSFALFTGLGLVRVLGRQSVESTSEAAA